MGVVKISADANYLHNHSSVLDNKSIIMKDLDLSVSVVIPLYNKKNTINRALQCAIEQLRNKDEIIVIDDGSTDGSATDLHAYFEFDTRLRVFHQKNMGVSVARNRGVNEAIHDYIVFLDADDWWLPGYRAKLANMIAQWPQAVAWTVGHYRVCKKEQAYIKSGLKKDELLFGNEFIRQYGRYSGLINSSCVCVDRKTIQLIGGFPEGATSGEDVYVWVRLGLTGGPIAVSPQPLISIERQLSLSDSKSDRDSVGFHYRYFCRKDILSCYEGKQVSAIKSFLLRNGVRQLAFKAGSGNKSQGWEVAKIIGARYPFFSCFCIAFAFVA